MTKYLYIVACSLVLMTSSAYADYTAVAISDEGTYGLASSNDEDAAIDAALDACLDAGGEECYVPQTESGEYMLGEPGQYTVISVSFGEKGGTSGVGIGIASSKRDAIAESIAACIKMGGNACSAKHVFPE